ncbi:FAD binding domain-containing protein [Streptomyces sp. NPDC048419]|uniref:FAD binding domain-containing protein n=1 Tax=Streptomyces sp. NPDC048419 TaxID=3365547 RepID=UPI003714D734
MTRHRELLESAELAAAFPIFRDAERVIADPVVRNRGTLGGSLCRADPSEDLSAVCTTLDASCVIQGLGGERVVPMEDFHQGPYETAVGDAEMLTEVRFPVRPGGSSTYEKVERRAGDWAVVSAGAAVRLTAKVTVRRFVAVDDCGTRINPMIIEGQVHGGLTDGVGMALHAQHGRQEPRRPHRHHRGTRPPRSSRTGEEIMSLLPAVDRAAFAVALADRLRQHGVTVELTATQDFVRALVAVPPVSRTSLYWSARVTLVRRRPDLTRFDEVFEAVFGEALLSLDPNARRSCARSAPGSDVRSPAPGEPYDVSDGTAQGAVCRG